MVELLKREEERSETGRKIGVMRARYEEREAVIGGVN